MATVCEQSEMYGQAIRSLEEALRNAIKLQEESLKGLTATLNEVSSAQNWQEKFQTVGSQMMALAQKNTEDGLQLLNESIHTSRELLKKVCEPSRKDAPPDVWKKMGESWETALGMMRTSTEAVVRTNQRAAQAWVDLAKKMCEARPEK